MAGIGNVDNQMSTEYVGGELYGTQEGDVVDSRGDNTVYTLQRTDGSPVEYDFDYVVNLGDGYSMGMVTEGEPPHEYGNMVLVGPDGTVLEIWGDPHVTSQDADGNINGAFDFKNNMTIQIPPGEDNPNGKTIVIETKPWRNEEQAVIGSISIYDTNTHESGSSDNVLQTWDFPPVEGEEYPITVEGDRAPDAFREINPGVTMAFGEGSASLDEATFYDHYGEEVDVDYGKNAQGKYDNRIDSDAEIEFGTTERADKQTEAQRAPTTLEIDVAEWTKDDGSIDWEGMTLAALMMVVFMNRQDALQGNIEIKLKGLEGENQQVDRLNSLLTQVIGKQGEDTNDPITLNATEVATFSEYGALDLDQFLNEDGTAKEGVTVVPNPVGDPSEIESLTIKGKALETSIQGMIDSSSTQSQQDLTKLQDMQKKYTQSGEQLSNWLNSLFQTMGSIIQNTR